MWSYWSEVSAEALRRACDLTYGSRERAAVAILTAAVVVVALWLWGSGDAAPDEIVSLGAKLAVAAALLVVFYIGCLASVPPKRDKAQREQITALTAAQEPLLAFVDDWDKGVFSHEFDESGVELIHVFVGLENRSRVQLTGVFVECERVSHSGGMGWLSGFPRKLAVRDSDTPIVNIPPGRTELILVAAAAANASGPRYIWWTGATLPRVQAGRHLVYTVRLRAYCNEGKPVAAEFDLSLKGAGLSRGVLRPV